MFLKGEKFQMKTTNEMSVELESRSVNEAFARTAISSFVSQLDPTISELNEIRTAVSEAVTNCVVHAYRDKIGKIYINVKVTEPDTVVIRIRDKGCGIENIKQAMEPLYTTDPNGERAGLGFAVMQSFCDALKVHSSLSRGTTITLTKRLSPRISDV